MAKNKRGGKKNKRNNPKGSQKQRSPVWKKQIPKETLHNIVKNNSIVQSTKPGQPSDQVSSNPSHQPLLNIARPSQSTTLQHSTLGTQPIQKVGKKRRRKKSKPHQEHSSNLIQKEKRPLLKPQTLSDVSTSTVPLQLLSHSLEVLWKSSSQQSTGFENVKSSTFLKSVESNRAFLKELENNKAMSTRQLLLLSNGAMHGSEYLQYAAEDIKKFLTSNNVSRILFVPFALHDHDAYEEKARHAFQKMGFDMESIHKSSDPLSSVATAQSIFVGGGNTFRLLKTLYEKKLVLAIRHRVLQEGMPYFGASAGTNIATVNICTTNDMPIVYPPTFSALNLVPFNINPHYVEPEVNSKHMGETRQQRIEQYFECEESYPVLGLKEGSMLLVEGRKATLKGLPQTAKLFIKNENPKEYPVESDLSFLLGGEKSEG